MERVTHEAEAWHQCARQETDLQELKPQVGLRKDSHAAQVAHDAEAVWQLDAGLEACHELVQHGLTDFSNL
jgi:hypothetical protein